MLHGRIAQQDDQHVSQQGELEDGETDDGAEPEWADQPGQDQGDDADDAEPPQGVGDQRPAFVGPRRSAGLGRGPGDEPEVAQCHSQADAHAQPEEEEADQGGGDQGNDPHAEGGQGRPAGQARQLGDRQTAEDVAHGYTSHPTGDRRRPDGRRHAQPTVTEVPSNLQVASR